MIYALVGRWEDNMERQDFRAGMVASVIANVNRDPKHRREPWQTSDFMPGHRPEKPKLMTPEESVGFVAMLNAALGGADMRAAA